MLAHLEPAERTKAAEAPPAPPVPPSPRLRLGEDGWIELLYVALGTLAIVAWAAIVV